MSILNVNQIQPVGSGQTVTISAANITATGTFSELNTSGVVTADSITVGNSAINSTSIGIGTTDTAGRTAGVGTAAGTLVYDTQVGLMVYSGDIWQTVKGNFVATGGSEDIAGRAGYKVHTYTGPGTFEVTAGSASVEYLIVAGGAGGGSGGGGGGAGGLSLIHI